MHRRGERRNPGRARPKRSKAEPSIEQGKAVGRQQQRISLFVLDLEANSVGPDLPRGHDGAVRPRPRRRENRVLWPQRIAVGG